MPNKGSLKELRDILRRHNDPKKVCVSYLSWLIGSFQGIGMHIWFEGNNNWVTRGGKYPKHVNMENEVAVCFEREMLLPLLHDKVIKIGPKVIEDHWVLPEGEPQKLLNKTLLGFRFDSNDMPIAYIVFVGEHAHNSSNVFTAEHEHILNKTEPILVGTLNRVLNRKVEKGPEKKGSDPADYWKRGENDPPPFS